MSACLAACSPSDGLGLNYGQLGKEMDSNNNNCMVMRGEERRRTWIWKAGEKKTIVPFVRPHSFTDYELVVLLLGEMKRHWKSHPRGVFRFKVCQS